MLAPVVSGTAVSVNCYLIPFLWYRYRSDAVALSGTGHLIVRSSWMGVTLYATMRVRPRYGESKYHYVRWCRVYRL